jgi:hypothetical protein
MAGRDSRFTNLNGKVPAREALDWLADRDAFFDSVWRTQTMGVAVEPDLQDPVFVPVAADGSVFHPGLSRGAGYTVGRKGEERPIADYREALAELQRMPIPYWRRPNETGAWGTVRGQQWARMEMADLGLPSEPHA